MLKLLAVCFLAFVLAKWNESVQATEELDAEEIRLLQLLEEDLVKEKRDNDDCNSDDCDDTCQRNCCAHNCDDIFCLLECISSYGKRNGPEMRVISDDGNGIEMRSRSSRRRRLSRRRRTITRRQPTTTPSFI